MVAEKNLSGREDRKCLAFLYSIAIFCRALTATIRTISFDHRRRYYKGSSEGNLQTSVLDDEHSHVDARRRQTRRIRGTTGFDYKTDDQAVVKYYDVVFSIARKPFYFLLLFFFPELIVKSNSYRRFFCEIEFM